MQKTPSAGKFTSIKTAIDSIIDASEDAPYIVKVGPGIYSEPLITLKNHVYVIGESQEAVIVEPDSNDHHVFSLVQNSGLYFLTIQNSGTNYAGIYNYDIDDYALCHKLTIKDCDIGILAQSELVDSYLYLEYVDFLDCVTNTLKINNISNKNSEVYCENLFIQFIGNINNPTHDILVDGNKSVFCCSGGNQWAQGQIGNGIFITNGGKIVIDSYRIRGYDKGIYADINGSEPYIEITDISFGVKTPNNTNIEIANSTAQGYFLGYSDYEKIIINPNSDFFIVNKDQKVITVAKKGGDFTSIKDAVDSISDNSMANRYAIYVNPGIFYEDEITCKPFVSIFGYIRTTIVRANNGINNLFLIPEGCDITIANLVLQPETDTNSVIRYYGGRVKIDNIMFFTTSSPHIATAINATNVSGARNVLNISNCGTGCVFTLPLLFKFSDNGIDKLSVNINNFYINTTTTKIAEIGIVSGGERGINTNVVFSNCIFIGDETANGINIGDGANISILSNEIRNFTNCIKVENLGNAPNLEIIGSSINNSTTYDILVEHPTASGSLMITSDKNKISIPKISNITAFIQDENDGAIIVSGDYY